MLSDTLPGQLAKRGHDVSVLTSIRRYTSVGSNELESIRVIRVDAVSASLPGVVDEFPYFLGLEEVVRRCDPDILHINNLPFLTTFQSVRVARRIGKCSVVQAHGVFVRRGPLLGLAQRVFLLSFGRGIFGAADRVVCLTQDDARIVEQFGCGTDKIRVLPNGVDTAQFRPQPNKQEEGLVLWVGRFVPEKGISVLLRAIRHLTEMGRSSALHVRVLLVGEGPITHRMKSMVADLGLERVVEFHHGVPHSQVPDLINRASIVTIPSLSEGLPYSLLEAMSCGKAVIGSDIAGIREVLQNNQNGILVRPGDFVALSIAIRSLLIDRSFRERLGEEARNLMVRAYDWGIVAERYEELYSEILGRGKLDTRWIRETS